TKTSSSLPSGVSILTVPGRMREISGVWPGRMPSSPASPGSETNFASPAKIDASALTTSTCMVAMRLSLLQGLGLLEGFVDGADHIERLLGQGIALAVHDHLEAADGFLERNVLAGGAGKHFGHVEGLR